MFFRLARGALKRRGARSLLIAATMTLGVSAVTAMLSLMLGVGDKINRELRAYGANLSVVPRSASLAGEIYGGAGDAPAAGAGAAYLREDEIVRLKTIFWAHNIVDFAPGLDLRLSVPGAGGSIPATGTWFSRSLETPFGETVVAGLRGLKSWWELDGRWPDDAGGEVLLGRNLAGRLGLGPGAVLVCSGPDGGERRLRVAGVVAGDGDENSRVFLPLALAQDMAGTPGLIHRIEVSALTTPENDLARRAARSPASLSAMEWETWYCTAYISSIAYQIEETLTAARAKPILQVSESEGALLGKLELLMLMLALLSLVCASLAMSNLITAGVLERGAEIGLMKALGAADFDIALPLAAENLAIVGLGAALGYGLGLLFSRLIGVAVFGAIVEPGPMVAPLAAAMSFLIMFFGCLPALRLLLSIRPAAALRDG